MLYPGHNEGGSLSLSPDTVISISEELRNGVLDLNYQRWKSLWLNAVTNKEISLKSNYFVMKTNNQFYKNKSATCSQGRPKGSYSIATTLRCRGRHNSFLWFAPLTLKSYLIILSVKQRGIKYHLLSLGYDLTCD